MATIGHNGALRRLGNSHAEAERAQAVAMVAVAGTTLWCGNKGLDKGQTFLLALFKDKLVLMQPTSKPQPETVLAEFAKRTYRITEDGTDALNVSFTLSRPYGRIQFKMLRRAMYAINTEVLEAFVASASAAEKAAAKSPPGQLLTAGDVHVFARMCAAYGPGAEQAVAVAEAQVTGTSAKKGLLTRRPQLVLAAFPDRLVLLDKNQTDHIGHPPVAEFARGADITITGQEKKHVDLMLRQPGEQVELRMARYGEERIDGLVLDAILAIGAG